MAVVVVILILGLSTLFVEGAKARSWSNRLMRMRVLAQFVTILIMLAVFYFARR
ncbi:MAG: HIG1 domain-containing protein [Alphaproteobacteria bacterium]|nr:HIG1 domain-containing protein [Alphaproteobacteria bacterium]